MNKFKVRRSNTTDEDADTVFFSNRNRMLIHTDDTNLLFSNSYMNPSVNISVKMINKTKKCNL